MVKPFDDPKPNEYVEFSATSPRKNRSNRRGIGRAVYYELLHVDLDLVASSVCNKSTTAVA